MADCAAGATEQQPIPIVRRSSTGPASVSEPSHTVNTATLRNTQALCPSEMAGVETAGRSFCVDRWEASIVRLTANGELSWPGNQPVRTIQSEMMAVSRSGSKPQGYISGAQAELACARAGKRLCALDEWVTACRGPQNTRYPYGNKRKASSCNDRSDKRELHPVARLFFQHTRSKASPQSMWQARWLNDPRLHELSKTVVATGSFLECTNDYGVSDMVGNLHEWIADPNGTFAGGFFKDTVKNGEGCEYRTTAHNVKYHDYSTGFRCCRDANTQEL